LFASAMLDFQTIYFVAFFIPSPTFKASKILSA
jgi:hypothetical protein